MGWVGADSRTAMATAPDAAGHGRKKAWPIIFTTNEQKSEYDEVCKMCQK